jgi:hypothetical protein
MLVSDTSGEDNCLPFLSVDGEPIVVHHNCTTIWAIVQVGDVDKYTVLDKSLSIDVRIEVPLSWLVVLDLR